MATAKYLVDPIHMCHNIPNGSHSLPKLYPLEETQPMSLEVIQPAFDAHATRFLSKNQSLMEALIKQVNDAIYQMEQSLQYSLRHVVNISDTGIDIDYSDTHIEHGRVVLIKALAYIFVDKGYNIVEHNTSSLVLDWKQESGSTLAGVSRIRTKAWGVIYQYLNSIENDLIKVALSDGVNNELILSVYSQDSLGRDEQLDYIKQVLYGYQSQGYSISVIPVENQYQVLIAW